MIDFFSIPIQVGDWVITPPSGAYGMVLNRVTKVTQGAHIGVERINARWGRAGWAASRSTATIRASGRVTVVHPPPDVIALFEATLSNTLTGAQRSIVQGWLHKGIWPRANYQHAP